jgi:hypothetical protein
LYPIAYLFLSCAENLSGVNIVVTNMAVVTHMDWLLTEENISTLIVVGGTCLFAMAGVMLGR